MNKLPCLIFALAICFLGTASPAAEKIVIGSKSYIEPIILGEMVAHLARQTGAEAVHKELGGSAVVFGALVKGDIDFYFDYTGTLEMEILKGEQIRGEADLRAALEKRGIRMGQPVGFNNTYALGMKEARAAALGIKTISDLQLLAETNDEVKRLKFGVSEEFVERKDGWPGLKEKYRLPFQVTSMDHNLAYRGLESGALDIVDIYPTGPESEY